ncbi:hypothetical protein PPACK8108_LOCUS6887 [Phakopsora pachyrhizi]|uniref:Uncharacterized protein n=1 Tax=Phakopsora pachyrhizi TaxID=170000 RepID=A0AAV0AVC9_PHAPC|nr:hypothetical protein PPACK8108_LOCUS6887 [Phakopsora pachyrhizi]
MRIDFDNNDEEKDRYLYGQGEKPNIEEEKPQRVDQTARLCQGCFKDQCLDLADFNKRSQKAFQTGNFPVDHPPREEDIQMNPPEQNLILQQPIVPPQRNNDDPQGIHKNNRAQDNPDPDEQQTPAQALLALQNENLFNRRNIHPASSGLARSISAFSKFIIPSPPNPEEHDIFENHKNEINGAISHYVNNSLDAARQMYGAID